MSALAAMQGRTAPLSLVIFDCDGVLVDSEPVANRVVAEALGQLGWAMTPEQANDHFLGTTLPDMCPIIEARLGMKLPPHWARDLTATLLERLGAEVTAVPGAIEALRCVSAFGIPWRVASNSSHPEMQLKFARIGVADLVAGRMHSFTDVARAKPAPDLFLAAAAAGGTPASCCVVIEDSVPGVRAAIAAGMTCLGFAPHNDGAHLRAHGAAPFHDMADLPRLISTGLGGTP